MPNQRGPRGPDKTWRKKPPSTQSNFFGPEKLIRYVINK